MIIELGIGIAMLVLMRNIITRLSLYTKNVLRYERLYTIYCTALKNRECSNQLKALYGHILYFYNNHCATEAQQVKVKKLLELTLVKIQMKEI